LNRNILLLIVVSLLSSADAEMPLPIERRALQSELDLAQQDPDRYYLLVNLFKNTVALKASGRVLLDAPIESVRAPDTDSTVSVRTCRSVISPSLPLAAFPGSRLAGRRLPLDFVGRLIEGPRKHDRLYFGHALMIVSPGSPYASDVTCVEISGEDMKSLSSAIEIGTPALLIRPRVMSR
jgi:hypothetical protein